LETIVTFLLVEECTLKLSLLINNEYGDCFIKIKNKHPKLNIEIKILNIKK
jgi:hypothetical protein